MVKQIVTLCGNKISHGYFHLLHWKC